MNAARTPISPAPAATELAALEAVAQRALAHTAHMVWAANHRPDALPRDPKVGGHPAACASSLHLAMVLHLLERRPQDFWCAKPHLAPLDHALNHMMGLFRDGKGGWLEGREAEELMLKLRAFSENGEPVFQSYHAVSDPDHWRTLPSGTVGIPPVNAGYLALTQRYLADHNLMQDQQAHFWCLLGDSEFREGSLAEAITDFGERELGEVTWILDYNRQSLDGTRLVNKAGFGTNDADRIEAKMHANGWDVIQLRHGPLRQAAFEREGGEELQRALETGFSDYEFQGLVWKREGDRLRQELLERCPGAAATLSDLGDDEIVALFGDLGGHDCSSILHAYRHARASSRPTMVIAHTIKGWGLQSYAAPGNHSAIPSEEEVGELVAGVGLSMERPYQRDAGWDDHAPAWELLQRRETEIRRGIEEVERQTEDNRRSWQKKLDQSRPLPPDMGINTSMMPLVHTQWMWGQIASKLVRIGVHDELKAVGLDPGRELSEEEQRWGAAADLLLTLSPDVGTSTNINPTMDGKIYGRGEKADLEAEYGWVERGRPKLLQTEAAHARHLRFEIAEQAAMSAAGSFGQAGAAFGVPLLPMMTIYDFFIKRALDQFYYNVYWRSSFLLIGTPSGSTLAPEGAQHSWKSDIQMPSMLTWEPFYAKEMEWILCDAVRRHVEQDNEDREGVVVRGVTMAVEQKPMLKNLRRQQRFQEGGQPRSDEAILEATRQDALAGGYWLVHHHGEAGYQPGDNVVRILSMGAPTVEALAAVERLREVGVYADLLVVTCPDLLLGRFAERNDYAQLKKLGLNGDLHLVATAGAAQGAAEVLDGADLRTLAGRNVPLVSVADGEPGLLDNAGSVLGVRQISLALTRFSKSGRPDQIFRYHGIDAEAIFRACGQALSETAERQVQVSPSALADHTPAPASGNWRELWPYDFD